MDGVREASDDGYQVDIVLVIDVTSSMTGILETVKAGALAFHDRLRAVMARRDMTVGALRVRVIAFRDFGVSWDDAIERTPFLTLPEDAEAFRSFVSGLRASGGGDAPESALEALALAVQSPWTAAADSADGAEDGAEVADEDQRRHFIVLFTDAAAHPLGKHTPGFARRGSKAPARPSAPSGPKRSSWFGRRGTPAPAAPPPPVAEEPDPDLGHAALADVYPGTMAELHGQWGRPDAEDAVMDQSAKRLLIFAPAQEPWPDIADTWDKTMFVQSAAGTGLSDVALDEVISTIARSV